VAERPGRHPAVNHDAGMDNCRAIRLAMTQSTSSDCRADETPHPVLTSEPDQIFAGLSPDLLPKYAPDVRSDTVHFAL